MAVSHENKLFFVHVPKNAGTALINSLGFQQHGHFKYDKNQVPKGYTTFCVVRHPLDRLVSCFEYARMDDSYWHSSTSKSKDGKHPDYDLLKNATMKECIQYLLEGRLRHLGWKTQLYWIGNTSQMDYIIKIENLKSGLNSMFTDLKLPTVENIPMLNASKRKNYLDYFDEKDIEILRNIYKEDFKQLGYD